jgi:hypothetical protein
MIEIEDPQTRDLKLREWIHLPEHVYAELQNGTKTYASFDAAQIGADRLSSVQYLKFAVDAVAPVAFGTDLPGCEAKTFLTDDQRAVLQEDLNSGSSRRNSAQSSGSPSGTVTPPPELS